MKVSILVPVYNVEVYIQRCAESLFKQSYSDCEFVFVNDCTPDNSIEVLKKCMKSYKFAHERVKIIEHESNRGLAASRLTGLKNASGDCVMFVDSDDYLELDAIETMVKNMEEEKCDIVSAGITHIFKNGRRFVDFPAQCDDIRECLKMMLERKVIMNAVARLYKRDLFLKLENPFIEGINFGEDYLMTSRIFYFSTKITYINKPVYNYIHTNSESYTFQFKRANLDNLLKVDSVITDFYQRVGESDLMNCHIVGRMKLKSEQLIMFMRSDMQKSEDYEYLKGIFIESQNCKYIRRLSHQDRIILWLSEQLPLWAMKIYVRSGYMIKQVLKQIKQHN